MTQRTARKPAIAPRQPTSIGELERAAGVTDRVAFWMPFAQFPDGFQRGVQALRQMLPKGARHD